MNRYLAATLGQPGTSVRRKAWAWCVILVAVLSLTLSLAGRYATSSADEPGTATSISADSVNAKTQHLLSDGLQWTAPASTFIMLVVPRAKSRIVHFVLPIINLQSEDWLYNRPPPAC